MSRSFSEAECLSNQGQLVWQIVTRLPTGGYNCRHPLLPRVSEIDSERVFDSSSNQK